VSALEQALTDYLHLRHSLGHELAEAGWLLPGFVAWLDAHGSPTVTIEAALAWAQQAPKSPAGRVTTVGPRRMTAARGFARYLSGIDAGTEVPPLGLMPRRAPWRRPFIYSAADIDVLLELARRTIVSPLRAATYQTLIGLLAASGPFSGGQDQYKWGVFTDHPGRAMINYSPSPREVLHMWRACAGQASDQQR